MQSTPTEQVVPEVADVADLEGALKDLIARRAFDELLATVLRLVDSLRKDNDRLRLEVQALKHKLYGRKSEKDPVKTAEEDKAPDKTENAVAATPEPPTSGSHGRGSRPEHMPTVLVEITLTPSQRVCPACQSEMLDATAAPAWRVEFVPGYFRVEDLRMQRVACPHCRSEFAQAKTPKVIKGSPVGAGLLARILTDKAEDHLPLDRQQKRMAREGYDVAKTTLANWWRQGCDLLMPLHPLLLKEAMSGFLPQLDATGLQVYLSKTKKTGAHHLWCAVGSNAVSFHYAAHKTKTLSEILACRSHLSLTRLQPSQSDGDTSFSAALKELDLLMVLLQCNMHARRKFVEALQSGDKRAKQAIKYYEQIYGIERECDEQNLTTEERTVQRMTRTFPVLEKFRKWAQCHLDSGKAVRGTPFHKALKYLSTRWLGLTCFVIDGRIAIENGEPERQIRWIAKGRDN